MTDGNNNCAAIEDSDDVDTYGTNLGQHVEVLGAVLNAGR